MVNVGKGLKKKKNELKISPTNTRGQVKKTCHNKAEKTMVKKKSLVRFAGETKGKEHQGSVKKSNRTEKKKKKKKEKVTEGNQINKNMPYLPLSKTGGTTKKNREEWQCRRIT